MNGALTPADVPLIRPVSRAPVVEIYGFQAPSNARILEEKSGSQSFCARVYGAS